MSKFEEIDMDVNKHTMSLKRELDSYNVVRASYENPEKSDRIKDRRFKQVDIVEEDDLFVVLGLIQKSNPESGVFNYVFNGEWWE